MPSDKGGFAVATRGPLLPGVHSRLVRTRAMTKDQHEIEGTYAVDVDTDVPALDQLSEVETVQRGDVHELEATYFDTADLALAGLGVTSPGSGLSEELALGCEPVTLESESFPRLPSLARDPRGDADVRMRSQSPSAGQRLSLRLPCSS